MQLHIGTSGWSYDHWQDIVYPSGTKNKDRLDYYLKIFDTVEVNSSFYHWPMEKVFDNWYRKLPPNFIMTIKAARNLTHFQKLYKPEYWVKRMEQSIALLREKMGVLLVQLPPSLGVDYARLEYFLRILPQHLRVAFEFRHHSWHTDETFKLLENYGKAYCVMSGVNLPCILKTTTDFVYVRLHGSGDPVSGGSYSEENLQWWKDRTSEWLNMQKAVYIYFNNDYAGHAVRNAVRLKELVQL